MIRHTPTDSIGFLDGNSEVTSLVVHECNDLPLPDPLAFAGVILMGGEQRLTQPETLSSFDAELELISTTRAAKIPLLGICLGAQLIAMSTGGEVRIGRPAEIEQGWLDVQLDKEAGTDLLLQELPQKITPWIWHNDTLTVPTGAIRLAASVAADQPQAFRVDQRTWGVVFHFEWDGTSPPSDDGSLTVEVSAPENIEAAERMEPTSRTIVRRFLSLCSDLPE